MQGRGRHQAGQDQAGRGRGNSQNDRSQRGGSYQRQRNGRSAARQQPPHGHPAANSPQAILEEAGRRKQAAQRRGVLTRGAGDHLRASVEGYRAALALPLPPGLRLEALFELGEAFLLLSEAVLGEATAAAGGPLLSNGATRARAADVERRGRLAAADFCRKSHEAYEQVLLAAAAAAVVAPPASAPPHPAADAAAAASAHANEKDGEGGGSHSSSTSNSSSTGRSKGSSSSSSSGSDGSGDGSEYAQEACVNSANALAAWADALADLPPADTSGSGSLSGPEPGSGPGSGLGSSPGPVPEGGSGGVSAARLLDEAGLRYARALERAPDDVEVLTNLADCAIRRAEVSCGTNAARGHGWLEGRALFERALATYERACSLADVRVGDDLPGLLQNWGMGLFSMAQRTPDGRQEAELYARAAEKLRHTAQFRPSDLSTRHALGEVLTAHAERLQSVPGAESASQALAKLQEALEDGYRAALRVDAADVEALLGSADVHLTAGKILAAGSDGDGARREFGTSRAAYERAVQLIQAGGAEPSMSFEEQSDVLYNLACACSLCGAGEAAALALRQLAAAGALAADAVESDEDLSNLKQEAWWGTFVETLRPT